MAHGRSASLPAIRITEGKIPKRKRQSEQCIQFTTTASTHRQRSMPEHSNDYRVVVFGAGAVGKTSLVLRFIKGSFKETYVPTVEDTYRQVINCDKNICTLQITDTTGSHHFPAMQRLAITRGHAFILVYAITSRQSFEELHSIYEQIRTIKGNLDDVPICVVGNKCDETERKVQVREGTCLASSWKCAFLETSAKNNYNVHELFQKLLELEKRRKITLSLNAKNKLAKHKGREKIKDCTIQ